MAHSRLPFDVKKPALLLAAGVGLAVSAVQPLPALARCPTAVEMMAVAAAYMNREPIDGFRNLRNMEEAYCAQGMLAAEIGRSMGVMAGYKAAFTSDSMRQRHQTNESQRGILYQKMFLKDGATVIAKYGARPSVTADLILVVKDYDILKAQTPLEALSHLSFVVPFIELSDQMLNEGIDVTPLQLVATNMGTRMGVLGAPIPVRATEEFLEGLAKMTVIMRDHEGHELGRAQGSEMLGNPVLALQWLARDLEQNAQRIQMNDRISVGAFFPGHTPTPGLGIIVQYEGLPGDPSVAVRFK